MYRSWDRCGAGHPVAQGLEGVEEGLLQQAREAHPLVGGEVLQHGSDSLLNSHGQVNPLDLHPRAGVVDVVAEGEPMAVQVAHRVVANAVLAIVRRHYDSTPLPR
jgi:hypothetical protein